MAHFYFREIAVNHPSNRGFFLPSKEVISYPFDEPNRFKEVWRGMYMFKNDTPREGDASFGDFYMEIDENNFRLLKSMVLTIVEYLFDKYKLKHYHLNFFITNRSIWISIPTKVFNCFGARNLHKIHKLMAEEINSHLLSLGYNKGLDLSIYRWNGLMRSLGSYLPKTKRWVTKFNLSDLDDAVSMVDLFKSKYDNGFTYQDIDVVQEAKNWFNKYSQRVNKENSIKIINKQENYIHSGMEKFIENGELTFHRNLHIYSIALYLKGKGLNEKEAINLIHSKFNNPYVKTREALRTIHSAFKGNKRFSPKVAKGFLDESIFEDNYMEKSSFIIPRIFIQELHKNRCHYKVYKYLFSIMHKHQIYGKSFKLDLSKNKYKKREAGYFRKLQSLGFISYAINDDILTAEFKYHNRELFQSHIVVPKGFVESKLFKKMKREFIVLAEIWRSGIKTSEDKNEFYFNIKENTLRNNLRMLICTIRKYISVLKKYRLIIGNFFMPIPNKSRVKEIIRGIISTKSIKKDINVSSCEGLNRDSNISNLFSFKSLFSNTLSEIIKCNYSTTSGIYNETLQGNDFG